jgi:mannose-6-phosphate isomerase-like protein (cupin superfamily)
MVIVRDAGEGETLLIGPTKTVVKVSEEATDGRLSVVEMHLPANWEGPPAHVHERVEHVWYVLSGEVRLQLDEVSRRYRSGACVYVPAGTPHTFNTDDCPEAILLEVDTPQALDGYFRELVEAFPPGQAVDPAEVGEIMKRHDTHPVIKDGS